MKWGFKSTIKSINKTTKPIFRLPLFRLLFVLPIEDNAVRTGQTGYFLPTEVIKDYNVMIDGKNKQSKNWYWSRKWLDYPYFEENFEVISMDLSQQQALDADPKAVQ